MTIVSDTQCTRHSHFEKEGRLLKKMREKHLLIKMKHATFIDYATHRIVPDLGAWILASISIHFLPFSVCKWVSGRVRVADATAVCFLLPCFHCLPSLSAHLSPRRQFDACTHFRTISCSTAFHLCWRAVNKNAHFRNLFNVWMNLVCLMSNAFDWMWSTHLYIPIRTPCWNVIWPNVLRIAWSGFAINRTAVSAPRTVHVFCVNGIAYQRMWFTIGSSLFSIIITSTHTLLSLDSWLLLRILRQSDFTKSKIVEPETVRCVCEWVLSIYRI